MPDTIEVATLFPKVIEVTITDLDALVARLEGHNRLFNLPHQPDANTQTRLNYRIEALRTTPSPEERRPATHELRTVALETLIAAEITSRIGLVVRKVMVEMAEAAMAGFDEDDDDGRLVQFNGSGEFTGLDEERLLELMDLGRDYSERRDGTCELVVLDIALNSPVKIMSTIRAMVLSVQLAASPTISTIDQINLAINMINVAINIANYGATIRTHEPSSIPVIDIKKLRKDFSDDRVRYYQTRAALNDLQPIQFDLRELKYYTKKIDNDFGKDSKQALKEFAISKNLTPDILPTDPVLQRALADAISELNYSPSANK